MTKNHRGFAPILAIILAVIVIGGGVYLYQNNQKRAEQPSYDDKFVNRTYEVLGTKPLYTRTDPGKGIYNLTQYDLNAELKYSGESTVASPSIELPKGTMIKVLSWKYYQLSPIGDSASDNYTVGIPSLGHTYIYSTPPGECAQIEQRDLCFFNDHNYAKEIK